MSPQQPAGVVSPGTVPDVNQMWALVSRVVDMGQADELAAVRWRITAEDWTALRGNESPGVIAPPAAAGEPWRLFGIDVEFVAPAANRWPELVFAVDRRRADPALASHGSRCPLETSAVVVTARGQLLEFRCPHYLDPLRYEVEPQEVAP